MPFNEEKENVDALENNSTKMKSKRELKNEKEFKAVVFIPKWLRIILMFLPAGVIVAIILIINYTVGFPENIFPTAIIAIIGMSLFGLVVLGDMAYRNIFVYRMLMKESKKSRIYKEIIREKQAERTTRERYEYETTIEEEYEYDNEEEVGENGEEEEEESEEEYLYEEEDEEEMERYRLKSYVLRGGILSIIIVNALVLIALAAILQIALFGALTPTE